MAPVLTAMVDASAPVPVIRSGRHQRTPVPVDLPREEALMRSNASRKAEETEALKHGIRRELAAGAPVAFRDLIKRLATTRWALIPAIRELVSLREIVQGPTPPGQPMFATSYRRTTAEDVARLPKVRNIEVPTFDPLALRQKVQSILRSGASYCLREIVRTASLSMPHATADTVTPVLDELVAAGTVRKIPIGAFSRFQAVA